MSETISLTTGESEIIYGTYTGAKAYIAFMSGAKADAWTGSTPDKQKKSLGTAARLLNAVKWTDTADTFAERDAIANADGKLVFQLASYELAVLVMADDALAEAANQGSNIQSVSTGGASVTYFNPTTKNAPVLPPILMRLVGSYLGGAGTPASGTEAQSGSATNPLSDCVDYDRRWPF